VTAAWWVYKLRMEERPPIWRVAANILNKQSWTGDKVWSSRRGGGLGEVLTAPHCKKSILLRNIYKNTRPALIFWYGLSIGEGT
jgi:hypothetical protein